MERVYSKRCESQVLKEPGGLAQAFVFAVDAHENHHGSALCARADPRRTRARVHACGMPEVIGSWIRPSVDVEIAYWPGHALGS